MHNVLIPCSIFVYLSIALAAEDLEVHYRDVGGAYKCEGCGTVMEACERAMRYHIQKQHHATAVKAKLLVLPKVADQQVRGIMREMSASNRGP